MTRFLSRGSVVAVAVALAVVVIAADFAAAQDAPGGRGAGFGGGGQGGRRGGGRGGVTVVSVAANEKVQGLIAATADQKTKITEISSKLQEEQQAALAGAADGGDFAAMQAASAKLVTEAEAKAAAALDATQNTKVLSIIVNVAGAQSLTNSQVAKHLKLTDAQKTTLAAIAPAGRGGGGGGGRGGMTPEEQAARDKQYTDVLTADQTAEFAKLKAVQAVDEELATELRPRGRGGRGGRGGAGGPGAGGPGGADGGFGGRGGRGQQ